MSLSIGIVGLPNAGKSTLFNALLKKQVSKVAEYPFTTIEPNTGVVEVEDKRLDRVAEALGIENKVPAAIKFYDIAGLVKGAYKGEGLGNQFLSHIREVDAILHLAADFEADNDPAEALKTVNLELVLSDLEALSNQKTKDKDKQLVLKKLMKVLEKGQLASEAGLCKEEKELIKDLNLLTLKPMLYVINVSESKIGNSHKLISICAKLEAEIAELDDQKREYLESFGLKEPVLDRLIKLSYNLLDLITFFTVKGGKQAQAWPIKKGSSVLEAAGIVHSDFKERFQKAEVIDWQKLVKFNSFLKAREQGKVRLVGREYVVIDGEVVEFKI